MDGKTRGRRGSGRGGTSTAERFSSKDVIIHRTYDEMTLSYGVVLVGRFVLRKVVRASSRDVVC